MPTLNGACPGCGLALTLELTVRTAPPVHDREPGQGGTPSSPDSGHERPTCPTCNLHCRLVEAVAKKGDNKGRRFTGWKCVNSDCEDHDKFAEFRWLDKAA